MPEEEPQATAAGPPSREPTNTTAWAETEAPPVPSAHPNIHRSEAPAEPTANAKASPSLANEPPTTNRVHRRTHRAIAQRAKQPPERHTRDSAAVRAAKYMPERSPACREGFRRHPQRRKIN